MFLNSEGFFCVVVSNLWMWEKGSGEGKKELQQNHHVLVLHQKPESKLETFLFFSLSLSQFRGRKASAERKKFTFSASFTNQWENVEQLKVN